MEKIKFDIPREARAMISPKERQIYFKNLVENISIYLPAIKPIYLALNFDSKLPCEYLAIFEAVHNKVKIILWDAPAIFTDKSLPGYRYAVKNNRHQDYFRLLSTTMSRTSYKHFAEFLESPICQLSMDPNSNMYWKKPENMFRLMSGMSEMSLRYKPNGFVANAPSNSKEILGPGEFHKNNGTIPK